MRAELDAAPARHARYRREYLGWGVFAVGAPGIPASLVRLGRTGRFRSAVAAMASALDVSPDEFSVQLVAALAALAQAMGRDLAEADWWRLLDALVLVAAHPVGRAP